MKFIYKQSLKVILISNVTNSSFVLVFAAQDKNWSDHVLWYSLSKYVFKCISSNFMRRLDQLDRAWILFELAYLLRRPPDLAGPQSLYEPKSWSNTAMVLGESWCTAVLRYSWTVSAEVSFSSPNIVQVRSFQDKRYGSGDFSLYSSDNWNE